MRRRDDDLEHYGPFYIRAHNGLASREAVVSRVLSLTLTAYCRYREPHSPLLYPQQMTADPFSLFTPLCEDTLVADGSA